MPSASGRKWYAGVRPARRDRALQNRAASHQETDSTGNRSRVLLGRRPVISAYHTCVTGNADQ